jgi:hypothetical protein
VTLVEQIVQAAFLAAFLGTIFALIAAKVVSTVYDLGVSLLTAVVARVRRNRQAAEV